MMAALRLRHTQAARRAALGGIDLLPHHARDRRAEAWQYGRCAALLVALGGVGAALGAWPEHRAALRWDAQLVELEQRWLALRPRVQQAERVAAAREAAQAFSHPRRVLADGFELLARLPYRRVRLVALHGDARGLTVGAQARNQAAALEWVRQLQALRPDLKIELDGVQDAERPALAAAVSRAGESVAFALRIEVPGACAGESKSGACADKERT